MRRAIIAAALLTGCVLVLIACRATYHATVQHESPPPRRTVVVHKTAPPPRHAPAPRPVRRHAPPPRRKVVVKKTAPPPRSSVTYTYPHVAGGGRISVTVTSSRPPARRREVKTTRPGRGWVWVQGYHMWSGSRFVWVRGRWVRPSRGYSYWVPGKWVKSGRTWRYKRGHWK